MQLGENTGLRPEILFQSSPAPKGRCNALAGASAATERAVSILTGPEGPMQHDEQGLTVPNPYVSILTGPEGPMQRPATSLT